MTEKEDSENLLHLVGKNKKSKKRERVDEQRAVLKQADVQVPVSSEPLPQEREETDLPDPKPETEQEQTKEAKEIREETVVKPRKKSKEKAFFKMISSLKDDVQSLTQQMSTYEGEVRDMFRLHSSEWKKVQDLYAKQPLIPPQQSNEVAQFAPQVHSPDRSQARRAVLMREHQLAREPEPMRLPEVNREYSRPGSGHLDGRFRASRKVVERFPTIPYDDHSPQRFIPF
jgi:hypothetical protein